MKNRFAYGQGDIEINKSQCELCKYNNPDTPYICSKYPDRKPAKVIKNESVCQYLFDNAK